MPYKDPEYMRKYNQTLIAKESKRRWKDSSRGKEFQKELKESGKKSEHDRKYRLSEKGISTRMEYSLTEKRINAVKKYHERIIEGWKKIIPEKTNCNGCGREIFFNSKMKYNTIHFDHRYEGKEIIKTRPFAFLSSHPANLKNIKIWKSCDFGMICDKCNKLLPTVGRIEWFKNVMNYATNGKYNMVEAL